MAYNTLLDLSKQAKIPLNNIAVFDGSMSIGQNFYITGVQIDTTNAIQDYSLSYDVLTNSFKASPQGTGSLSGNRVFYGMSVSAITNLDYYVSSGIYKIADDFISFIGDTVTINSGDSTYARFDILYVSGGTSPNDVFVLEGTPSATPVIPTLIDPDNDVAIAILYVPANTTAGSGGPVNTYYTNLINAYQVIYSRGIYTDLSSFLDGNYIRPEIKTFTNSLNELEFGNSANTVTFNWTTNKTGYQYGLVPTGATYNNTTFDSTLVSQNIYSDTTGTTATTFTLTFDDGVTSVIGYSNVSFYNKRYVGVFSGTSISNSEILGLSTKDITYSKDMGLKYLSGGGNYVYICYPARLGETDFFVNGLFTNAFTLTTMNFTNQYGFTELYNIYRTDNVVNSSKMGFEIRV